MSGGRQHNLLYLGAILVNSEPYSEAKRLDLGCALGGRRVLSYRVRIEASHFSIQDPLSVVKGRLDVTARLVSNTVGGREDLKRRHAFFCKRAMLVHFFSSIPSYLFAIFGSNTSSPRFTSLLSAAAVSGRSLATRYAIIDLCLYARI